MFGMKRQDADALLDDVVRLGQARRRRVAQDDYVGPSAEDLKRDKPLHEARSENIHLAAKNLKVSTALDVTRQKLGELMYDYCDVVALVNARTNAMEDMIQKLARATGVDESEIRRESNAVMRSAYDSAVESMLSTKQLTKDPRTDPENIKRRTRDWYYER